MILEIRGAEGGEEANLFARDLAEMYQAYAADQGWKVEVLGAQPSDMGGYTEIALLVKGDGAWRHLKYEGGPHRVQRVPVTESQGRVHTSSATVSVLPEAEEVDVQIDPNDLQIDVYRASGPGGQSVNTTDSAVRITHLPTGTTVSMQDEKSQLQNRAKALRVLRSRLLRMEQERQAAEQSDQRRGQIGGGGRSEKIRTYNFKENRVSDHRIDLTLYKLDRVLAGELGTVTDALLQDERSRQLGESVSVTWRELAAELAADLGGGGPRQSARRRPPHRRGGVGAGGGRVPRRPRRRRPPNGAWRPWTAWPLAASRANRSSTCVGRWGFRSLDLFVDRRVLIPRPETEIVAGYAMDELDRRVAAAARWSDLGTGSGAIALSIAVERPRTRGLGHRLVRRSARRGPGQPGRHRSGRLPA